MKICIWCQKEPLKNRSKNYCSMKCCIDHKICEKFLDWYVLKENKVSNKVLRSHLEIIYGHRCSNCQITEWNNKPIVFEVEHKDGNSKNNDPDNVCLLCANCHSLTLTYKTKNIGKGRFSIKNVK